MRFLSNGVCFTWMFIAVIACKGETNSETATATRDTKVASSDFCQSGGTVKVKRFTGDGSPAEIIEDTRDLPPPKCDFAGISEYIVGLAKWADNSIQIALDNCRLEKADSSSGKCVTICSDGTGTGYQREVPLKECNKR